MSRSSPRRLPWLVLVTGILVVGAFECLVAWLALHPAVDADYRAYYLEHTTTCLDKPVVGTYTLGATISFLPDDQPGARKLRVCGWDGPAGDGTHAVGTSSRLRFAVGVPPGELILSLLMTAVVAPGVPEQHIIVSTSSGMALGRATITAGQTEMVSVNVPAEAVENGRLDVVLGYPNAAEMRPRDSLTHYRSIKLLAVQLRRPDERAMRGPEEDLAGVHVPATGEVLGAAAAADAAAAGGR